MSSKLKKNETDKTDVGHIDGRKQNDEYSNDFTDIFFIFSRKRVEKTNAVNPYNNPSDLLYCAA
jgi:hypothetical protein